MKYKSGIIQGTLEHELHQHAKAFSFPDHPFKFRWLIGSRSVYVYASADDEFAASAAHIDPDEDATYEEAQAAAWDYVLRFEAIGDSVQAALL